MIQESVVWCLLDYLKHFIGKPYVWGGKNAGQGGDCSELVQEGLRSVGMDQPHDQTAQELHDYFMMNGEVNAEGPGALLFFGKGTKSITHIAIQNNSFQMIEAGGGDSSVTSPEIAATRRAAMVRIRPINSRNDFVVSIMPNYWKASRDDDAYQEALANIGGAD